MPPESKEEFKQELKDALSQKDNERIADVIAEMFDVFSQNSAAFYNAMLELENRINVNKLALESINISLFAVVHRMSEDDQVEFFKEVKEMLRSKYPELINELEKSLQDSFKFNDKNVH